MQGSSVQVYQVYEVTRFKVGVYEVYEVPSSRLKLKVGGWKLEVGGWRLGVGGWRLGVGGLELFLREPPQPALLLVAWTHRPLGDLKCIKI